MLPLLNSVFFFEKFVMMWTFTQHFCATLGAPLILTGYDLTVGDFLTAFRTDTLSTWAHFMPHLLPPAIGQSFLQVTTIYCEPLITWTTPNYCTARKPKHRIAFSSDLHIDTCQLLSMSKELSDEARDMHRAITSLMEETEAVDWYNQRVDVWACKR